MKKILIFLSFILLTHYIIGQNIPEPDFADFNYTFQHSPESASFKKYWFNNQINNQGKPNASVPIYTINAGFIEIPISLNYSFGGLKVNEMSTFVGLGWNLVAAGRIQRSIKGGHNDLYQKTWSGGEDGEGGLILGFQRRLHPSGAYYFEDSNSSTSVDQLPDIFTASAPGLFTSFFYDRDGVVKCTNSKTIDIKGLVTEDYDFGTINGKGLQIELIHDEYTSFEITNEKGIKYYFQEFENSNTLSNSLSFEANATNWVLTKITNPLTNENIQFEYESVDYIKGETVKYECVNNGADCGIPLYGSSDIVWNHLWDVKRLKKIVWDEGEVNFKYNHSRQDIEGEGEDKALTEILVHNRNGNLIKQVELKYNYFISPGGNEPSFKRLKLQKVSDITISDNPSFYEFVYNTTALPHRNSKEQDAWGYYNKNGATTLIPKLYFYPDNQNIDNPTYCFLPVELHNSNSEEYIIDGADRSPDLEKTKACVLEEIILPTGGSRKFNYKLNTIDIDNETIEVGGLCLSLESFISQDETYNKIYEYKSGNALAIPQFASLGEPISFASLSSYKDKKDYLKNKLYRTSHSILNSLDLNPYEIIYNTVNIITEGKDKIVLNYHSLKPDYSSINYDIFLSPYDNGCININSKYDPSNLTLPTRNILSGKLKLKVEGSYINNIFSPVRSEKYNYKLVNNIQLEKKIRKKGHTSFINCQYKGGLLEMLTVKEWLNSNVLSTVNEYTYDNNLDILLSITKQLDDQEHIVTRFLYPYQLNFNLDNCKNPEYLSFKYMANNNCYFPFYKEVFRSDKKNDCIYIKEATLHSFSKYEESNKPRILMSGSYKHVKNEIGEYKQYYYTPTFSMEGSLSIEEDSRFIKTLEIEEYNQFVAKPNIINNLKDGIKQSIVWAYNCNYPFIIAKNVDYNTLFNTFENTLINLGFSDFDHGLGEHEVEYNEFYSSLGYAESKAEKDLLNQFVTKLRNSLPGIIFTISTYKPLVGITSQTDTNGLTSFYEYDEFGRLITLKDNDGNILQSYEYHYQNQ